MIAKRQGRLYLDCHQNGYGKTIVAPYSPRALDGAPVSAPLKWSEVVPGLDAGAFTIATLPKRLDKVGKPAPQFAAEDVKGSPLRLASYRGKYVLVDFWATWCAPCIAELPRLQAAYRTYHDSGFEIISISLDENKGAVTDFVKARNIPWPQLHNATSRADLVESFGVITIPAV